MGVKPQAIQWLCRKATSSKHSYRIAQVLRVPADWLINGTGDGPNPDVESASVDIPPRPITPEEWELLQAYRLLTRSQRAAVTDQIHKLVQANRELMTELLELLSKDALDSLKKR